MGTANPMIGAVGKLEFVEEDRVEIPIRNAGPNDRLQAIVDEVKKVFVILSRNMQ
jgi:hypothetical protein